MDVKVCHTTKAGIDSSFRHPLDPLSAAELSRAARLIRDHYGWGDDLRVETIDLGEPSKDVVRLRTLSGFAGEADSSVQRVRVASRTEVRAPSSTCIRSSSGVQRTDNRARTGETVTSFVGTVRRQRQARNRGTRDLDRAEQGLQPLRATVLEGGLRHVARRTCPVAGNILCQLTAQHALLQRGQ